MAVIHGKLRRCTALGRAVEDMLDFVRDMSFCHMKCEAMGGCESRP